jgi:hypothetical protein
MADVIKALAIKHVVSDHSEWEMHETEVYLYELYCRFYLNMFSLAWLVSLVYQFE